MSAQVEAICPKCRAVCDIWHNNIEVGADLKLTTGAGECHVIPPEYRITCPQCGTQGEYVDVEAREAIDKFNSGRLTSRVLRATA